ncbi:U32 family peptidase [Clostridium sp.]|uniref:U32 family peptidase n=1 Tax=Clostridium sp. TaxID=1506 RepID=UPI001A5161E2|nr:U32 family peptidase [Clostridium sp.]MBK5242706.1 U32 family peptidase [Clostridium sp.]
MDKIELLAPAGSMESVIAAVQMGADAVYIGGSKFSARAFAYNFDNENIARAVDYCHIYGVRVYVTVNTLVKDNELNEIMEYVGFLYSEGVDALILQDTGLIYLVKNNFPDFEMHASTQMTIHNGEGALLLKDIGFKRIVLSRELSLKEVNYISNTLKVETEVFVHGALCICYSGQCLMSSIIGGRSGNRGRCAQPCRLPYTLIDKNSNRTDEAYLLSPKDICTIDNLKDIVATGTSSLKIEGRMKKPEYVAGVVEIYRRALDNVYNNTIQKLDKDTKVLTQLFNREGFSKAYLYCNTGKDMMAYKVPKNSGLPIGRVASDLSVTLLDDVVLKDGIMFSDDGFSISKIILNGLDVEKAEKGNKVMLKPTKYKAGDFLYKISDVELMNELAKSYSDKYKRKIDLNLSIEFSVNKPLSISASYMGESFHALGDLVQVAVNKPLESLRIIQNLSKTGDTPFKINAVDFESFEEGFVPMSALNSVRRELIDDIQNYIIGKYKREKNIQINYNKKHKEHQENQGNTMPETLIYVTRQEQLKAVLEMGFDNIAINPFMRQCNIDLTLCSANMYLKISNIIKGEFESVCEFIENNLCRVKGIITANLGIINRFNKKITIIGDYKLNVFNRYSGDFYENLLNGTCISAELNQKEIKEIAVKSSLPLQIMVYGKYELMVSEYCAIGSVFGNKSEKNTCVEKCTKGRYTLKDRKGAEFSINTDKYCRSYIYNNVPVNLISNMSEIVKNNIFSFRLDFLDENYEETIEVLNNYIKREWQGELKNYTRGHYKRGVD